jgi:poly(beta-D-mannuronate) lyase
MKIFIIFFTLLFSGFSHAGYLINQVENKNNIVFSVKDTNASYFDVLKRIELLKISQNPILLSAQRDEFDCNEKRTIEPSGYITIPPYYADDRSYTKNPEYKSVMKLFKRFDKRVTRLAEMYVSTLDDSYARCLVDILTEWSKDESLLHYQYKDANNKKQAWYTVGWSAANAGMAYSIVKDSSLIPKENKIKIENWLNKVAHKLISFPGGPGSCCANLSYWRGLAAIIIGVVSKDNILFRFGVERYISALKSMNQDGSLPLEMKRGKRALHYQRFAIFVLVYIAEVAYQQGYNLYDIEIDGKSLHLAIDFLMKGINNVSMIEEMVGKEQDISFITKKGGFNWMEPYSQRYTKKEVDKFLKKIRPVKNYSRGGGNSTLYFYQP